ncbi:hypothetical protein [Planotetraspora phitsanulokensis]|nr:hypothetical protein [Planotetraspora phitsanulokensis]
MMSSPRGSRRRRPVLVPVASAVVVAGIGLTAATGGLAQASEEPPPKVAPGKVIDQGQFRTQFVKAVDTTEKDSYGGSKRYLKLTVQVTNLGDETVGVGVMRKPGDKVMQIPFSFAGSILRVRPEPKTKYGPDISVMSFGMESKQLLPDLMKNVVLKYELDPAATAPSTVTVDVGRFVYEQLGIRDQAHYWQLVGDDDGDTFVPTVAAEVTLPVTQERG